MNKIRLLGGISLMIATIGCLGFSYTLAVSVNIDLGDLDAEAEYITRKIIPIHFADNGNDFGGFMYLANDITGDYEGDLVESSLYSVYLDGYTGYVCKIKLNGFYYNAERGERLWPLDENTWENLMPGLTVTGGIYTLCGNADYEIELQNCENMKDSEPGEGGDNPQPTTDECIKNADINYFKNSKSYYGQVLHNYSGQDFNLVIGVDYKKNGNWLVIDGSKSLSDSFLRFENQFPMGFVYDYNGGLGFAGCEIKQGNKTNILNKLLGTFREGNLKQYFVRSGSSVAVTGDLKDFVNCENIGTMADSLMKLVVEGIVGMNRESDLGYDKNQTDVKMQFFGSEDINNSTLLSYVKQRSEILCRGKWRIKDFDYDYVVNDFEKSNVVCLDYGLGQSTVGTGISGWTKDNGKTLIVKNANVVIEPSTDMNDSGHYDIFVKDGNLIINETESTKKFVFTTQGFISGGIQDYQDYTREVLKNDRIGQYTGEIAGLGSFIRGNFIIDGNIKGIDADGKLKNKYFIYGKFTTKNSIEDLKKIFVWRCGENGRVNGTGDYCPKTTNIYYNPYGEASLVVIDQSYNSPLYW